MHAVVFQIKNPKSKVQLCPKVQTSKMDLQLIISRRGNLCFALLILPFFLNSVSPIIVTPEEETALTELKEIILDELPPKFGSSDGNIVRYLRARDLDVNKTVIFIRAEVQWWKELKMDTIHSEDWSTMEWELPMRIEGYDKKGQAILYLEAGEWDVRGQVVTGNTAKFRRWLYKKWDEARIETVKQADAGKNVTKWLFLIDTKGIPWTNVAPLSMSVYPTILLTLVEHFQLPFEQAIMINAPALVEVGMTMMRNLAPNAAKLFKIYGSDEKIWKPILRDLVDPKTLRKRYGGDKEDKEN